MLRERPKPLARAEAEALAVAALDFLGGDGDRLGRFLAVSGIGPESLRRSASEPGFLSGVLDFLLSDEPMLVAFAAEAGIPPERVAAAQRLLDGHG